ncbi:Hypothetical predicted protein [Marmota monax]|uniref:Uncharacterized protein n=1 Tax=Marmota monax TaxID=9995 RepID=A0A5E4AAL4_MARMO|nr:hypothetical protein GHT09_004048 [Marmota monax]VTJ54099.1 Hypothetical predicted protein [Marmota monax]
MQNLGPLRVPSGADTVQGPARPEEGAFRSAPWEACARTGGRPRTLRARTRVSDSLALSSPPPRRVPEPSGRTRGVVVILSSSGSEDGSVEGGIPTPSSRPVFSPHGVAQTSVKLQINPRPKGRWFGQGNPASPHLRVAAEDDAGERGRPQKAPGDRADLHVNPGVAHSCRLAFAKAWSPVHARLPPPAASAAAPSLETKLPTFKPIPERNSASPTLHPPRRAVL